MTHTKTNKFGAFAFVIGLLVLVGFHAWLAVGAWILGSFIGALIVAE